MRCAVKLLEDLQKEIQENHKESHKKKTFFGIYNFKTKPLNFNTDDSKTLFSHCLLHLISLKGPGENTIAKTALKT